MNIEDNIKKWVVLDNKYKILNNEIKSLRNEKNIKVKIIKNHIVKEVKKLVIV